MDWELPSCSPPSSFPQLEFLDSGVTGHPWGHQEHLRTSQNSQVQAAKPWGPLERTFHGGAALDLQGLVLRKGWAPAGTGVAWPGTAPVSPWVCWR